MKIPADLVDRDTLYEEVIKKCTASQENRAQDYDTLRQYYLFGGDTESGSPFNKIYPQIDMLTSFLYASETTKFSIHLGSSAKPSEYARVPVLTRAINDKWLDSNADRVASNAITWALVNNTSMVKLIPRVDKNTKTLDINPFVVHAASFGVYREDISFTDRQEAMTHTYYTTRSQLEIDLEHHPHKAVIMESASATSTTDLPESEGGIGRLMMATQEPFNQSMAQGNVEFGFNSMTNYVPDTELHELVTLNELWIWDTDKSNYRIVTKIKNGATIYDRIASDHDIFLTGDHPFTQVAPSPLPFYYWGMSEVAGLAPLQDWYNERIMQIKKLLNLQVRPPTDATGFGTIEERDYALFSEGGLLSPSDMMAQNPKLTRHAPDMPADLFTVLHEIETAFADYSGLPNTIQGKGETGVRSGKQTSELARLGSSRIKKRALVIEDALERLATQYLKLMMKYDGTEYVDEDGNPFCADQFTQDFVVKVDAHSNSPIFIEDKKDLALKLFEMKVIDRERLIEMMDLPDKEILKREAKKLEEQEAASAKAQQQFELQKEQVKHPPKQPLDTKKQGQ